MPLVLENISKIYGSRLLYRHVNLTLRPASIHLVTGANGTGKSTLLRIMAGLSLPETGTVTRSVEAEEVGYLGHATFIYPDLSALENLLFWTKAYGIKAEEKKLLDMLDSVGLLRFAHDRAGIFSRGMAQRLNLARLLLQKPRLIMLDEPGTGLDPQSKIMLKQHILDFRSKGAAVVWVSHDVEEDSPLADYILHIENREITLTKKDSCAEATEEKLSKNLPKTDETSLAKIEEKSLTKTEEKYLVKTEEKHLPKIEENSQTKTDAEKPDLFSDSNAGRANVSAKNFAVSQNPAAQSADQSREAKHV